LTLALNYAVGARVRSYDFPGHDDCYIEGLVLDVNRAAGVYRVLVDTVVWEGRALPVREGRVVSPPLNGRPGMWGPTKGVVLADVQIVGALE